MCAAALASPWCMVAMVVRSIRGTDCNNGPYCNYHGLTSKICLRMCDAICRNLPRAHAGSLGEARSRPASRALLLSDRSLATRNTAGRLDSPAASASNVSILSGDCSAISLSGRRPRESVWCRSIAASATWFAGQDRTFAADS